MNGKTYVAHRALLKVSPDIGGFRKAAEDCRTPKPVGFFSIPVPREASWSAAVLCRFLLQPRQIERQFWSYVVYGLRLKSLCRVDLLFCAVVAFLVTFRAQAQTNLRPSSASALQSKSAGATSAPPVTTNAVRAEQIRAECVAGRRMICGRVLKVLPDGLVVESGYTNLLRKELHGSWALPGTVVTSRELGLVESQQPDSPCVGTVFLTDLPRPRGGGKVKVKPYDYVVLRGYPAGSFTYSSVGGIQRTARRFSVGLETAVNLRLQQ